MTDPVFPVVVSAPSGAGKTSLCREVVRRYSGFVYSISVTSRPRLATEQEGEDYFFVSREQFEEGIRRGDFIEWTEIRERYYGTPRKNIERILREGNIALLDLDIRGARKMKEIFSESVTIYILSPSLRDLEKRLRKRGRDPEEEIRTRLESASDEMRSIGEYDYVFVNEDFEDSVERLRCIIEAERYRVRRQSNEWKAP